MTPELLTLIDEISRRAEISRKNYAHTRGWTRRGDGCVWETQRVSVKLLNRIQDLDKLARPLILTNRVKMLREKAQREGYARADIGGHVFIFKKDSRGREICRVDGKQTAADSAAALTAADLEVGHTYRAKRPAPAGTIFDPLVNDRQIRWIGFETVQYDSPSVAAGRRYPTVTIEAFLKWAARDVTDELPDNGDWADWNRQERSKNK